MDLALEIKGSPVAQVDQILTQAIELGASDIHIEPFERAVKLRLRLDGVLYTISEISVNQKDALVSRIKILSKLDIAEKRRPQDGRIQYSSPLNGKGLIDIRVSVLPTSHGEKVVMRILDKSQLNLSLQALGFDDASLQIFKEALSYPYGMILVTGPTGSGKTTTLYSALNELNNDTVNITTIEDPVEYKLDGINQSHVNEEIGLTFSALLRSILRQDPNVIMLGEIRDSETAEIAIRAALTGHLVFSTLHTNDAPSAVSRLIDMGVEPFLVSSSVRLVLAQRLVRKICEECVTTYEPDSTILEKLGLDKSLVYKKGEGCERCNGSGYKGRTSLIELMPISESLNDLIVQNASVYDLRAVAKEEGMTTLRDAGIRKIKDGITTPEEVFKETLI